MRHRPRSARSSRQRRRRPRPRERLTWEYNPDSAHVVGGLDAAQRADVENLAQRIADAVTVRRIGIPFNAEEGASDLKEHPEGQVIVWYQEDYRDNTVLVCRVQHLGPDAPGERG